METKPKSQTMKLIEQAKKARAARKQRERRRLLARKKGEKPSDVCQNGTVDFKTRSLTLPETRLDLLSELRVRPMVYDACRKLNISTDSYHHHRKTDQAFADAADDAQLEGWERLEGAAFDEALKPSQPGLPTGKLKEFLLKGRKRHVYGDKLSVEQEHRHEVHINLVPVLAPVEATPALSRDVIDAEIVEADTTPESEEP
jgi:hypothetical protein